MPLSAQDRWDGADDLDVNPLACGMGDEAADDGDMEEETEMMEYDGGQVAMAREIDMRGNPITLVDVPKLVGIGYFAATTLGSAASG